MTYKQYTVEELVNNPSFVKWAIGELDTESTAYWNEWVKQSEENRKTAILAQKKITGFRFQPASLPNLQSEWDRVENDITGKKYSWFKYWGKADDRNTSLKWMNRWFKVAAFVLVGVFAGLYTYNYETPDQVSEATAVSKETISTEYKEKKTIDLPDGSTIILASGSQLTYNSNWLEHSVKKVHLAGEAYFSISPDTALKDQPKFVVETRDGTAAVWGTEFTVNTHNSGTEVVLKEGEVRVSIGGSGDGEESVTRIHPGDMATIDRTESRIDIKEVNPKVYTSWTTDELYFDDTPFSVLVDRIERTYGVEVVIKDPKISGMSLSGSIDFKSLAGLIEAVSKLMEISIEKTSQTVIIG